MKIFLFCLSILGLLWFLGWLYLAGIPSFSIFRAGHYKGPKSEHFDGKNFFSRIAPKRKGSFFKFYRMRFLTDFAAWPEWIDSTQHSVAKVRVDEGRATVTFINHATALIQIDGVNILTDPIWSERSSPLSWLGPKRVRLPGVRFEDLPPIDLVIISHDHFDHMDIPTLKKLSDKFHPTFLVGLGNKNLLEGYGIKSPVRELDWWETTHFGSKLQSTFTPAQHWSARGPLARNSSLWGGFFIRGQKNKIFFAGDSGYGEHFKEICNRYGEADVALLPVGAYAPRWFMQYAHMNPEEALGAQHDLGAKLAIAIHFGTFHLSQEGINEPKAELEKARRIRGIEEKTFVIPEFGEAFVVEP